MKPHHRTPQADLRGQLSEREARGLLGLLVDGDVPLETPADDALFEEALLIVERNFELGHQTAHLREQGLQPSPIWESGSPKDGTWWMRARLAVLPPVFRSRYFEGAGAAALQVDAALDDVCEVIPLLMADPVGACFALENTLRTWLDDTAPTRELAVPHRPFRRLLSLTLADFARKSSAGLTSLEWFASLGLETDELRSEGDPSPTEISQNTAEKLRSMWEEERRWLRAAFGR